MRIAAGIAAALVLLAVLADAFFTVILARRTDRVFRVAGRFYRMSWPPFCSIAKRIRDGTKREDFLAVYGPLSFLVLLFVWASAIIICFGALHWAAGLNVGGRRGSFADSIYYSGAALFTAQLPEARNAGSRALNIIEAGLGFSFLGLTISYMPMLYTSYSSRESRIFLMDVNGGSPPSAVGFLASQGNHPQLLAAQFAQWQHWAAQTFQNQLSYPMLAYFRSPHKNQSWLASMISVLDAASIATLCADGELRIQAEVAFAICRHAVIDIENIFNTRPARGPDRLTDDRFRAVQDCLARSGAPMDAQRLTLANLNRRREQYEPQAQSLSCYFMVEMPPWLPDRSQNNWQTDGGSHENQSAVSEPFTSTT